MGTPAAPAAGNAVAATSGTSDPVVPAALRDFGGSCYLVVLPGTRPVALWVTTLLMPACPAPAPGVPAPTGARRATAASLAVPAQQVAETYWRRVPLPVPRAAVPPGCAITGMPAYLVTRNTVAPAPYRFATPLGPLIIVAHGAYLVDWGDVHDPGWSGPYPYEGEPYPNGTISHTYDWTGTVTITVREVWTATWRLGPWSGDLSGLATAGAVHGYRVYQLQSIITQ